MNKPQKRICILSHQPPVYSETFIKAQLDKLPAKILFFHGGFFPMYKGIKTPIVPNSFYDRVQRRISKKFFRQQSSWRDREALEELLIQEQVDVVLAEYGMTGSAILPVCQKIRIPLVVHFHGYDAYNQRYLRQYEKSYRQLFKDASAIIVVSQDMKQQLLKLGASLEKLHYNPYGVDLSLFQQANPEQNPPNLLSVGRFVEKKAPQLTILAFKEVAETYPNAKLLMIGKGLLFKECQKLVSSLGLETQVQFLGACSHEQVAAHMQNARAFVQHSVCAKSGDSEGTPVAVLEASASGLPIISTRHGGIKDVVIEEKTGLLCDERDVRKMAENMIQIVKSPSIARKLGQAGHKRITQHFSLEKSISNLWAIIEKVI